MHHSHDSEPCLIGRFIRVAPFVNAILYPDALTAALTCQGKLSEWLPWEPPSDAAAGHFLQAVARTGTQVPELQVQSLTAQSVGGVSQ